MLTDSVKRLAQAVSIILHPFVLAMFIYPYLPWRAGYSGAAYWWIIAMFFTFSFLIPLAYLITLKRMGKITDLDIKDRKQRKQHYLAFLVLCSIQFLITVLVFDSSILWAYTFAYMFNTAVNGLINMRWKISIHGASFGALIGVLCFLEGWSFLLLLLLLPILLWSRVKLEYHTPAQVITGAALGGILIYLELLIFTSVWPPV
jgi:hypothetical protein